MVASCYRRSGDYTAALEKYKWIHQHFPDDIDCKILKFRNSSMLKTDICYSFYKSSILKFRLQQRNRQIRVSIISK